MVGSGCNRWHGSQSAFCLIQVPVNLNYVDGKFFASGYYGKLGKSPKTWQLIRAAGSFPYDLEVWHGQDTDEPLGEKETPMHALPSIFAPQPMTVSIPNRMEAAHS